MEVLRAFEAFSKKPQKKRLLWKRFKELSYGLLVSSNTKAQIIKGP